MTRIVLLSLGLLALAACADTNVDQSASAQTPELQRLSPDILPNGRRGGTLDNPDVGFDKGGGGHHPKTTSNVIKYHGGPVMLGTVDIYYIWYGDQWTSSDMHLLEDLAVDLSGSPYYNINTTYTDGTGSGAPALSNRLALVQPETVVPASSAYGHHGGTRLTDSGVQQIVRDAIGAGPPDPNGVYFVLTSGEIAETSGFCHQYCGWHTYTTVQNVPVKYAFVGDPTSCLRACAPQSTSPNGSPGADAMASIIAHELEESATDPQLNAWYFPSGYENADECAWTFGQTATDANGAHYNMVINGHEYLIQQNWVNAQDPQTGVNGYCDLAYP